MTFTSSVWLCSHFLHLNQVLNLEKVQHPKCVFPSSLFWVAHLSAAHAIFVVFGFSRFSCFRGNFCGGQATQIVIPNFSVRFVCWSKVWSLIKSKHRFIMFVHEGYLRYYKSISGLGCSSSSTITSKPVAQQLAAKSVTNLELFQ